MSDDPATASARAAEEIAKAAGKGIDAATGLGRFFDRIFGSALDELGGALADRARYWRASRLLRLEERYRAACAIMGEDRVIRPVEPKFAFALLEAASLEDDDDLQDMFAHLLANATTDGTGVEDRKAYVSILQELKPLDARLLVTIARAKPLTGTRVVGSFALVTNLALPRDVQPSFEMPSPDVVQRALWNLVRTACIQPFTGVGGRDGAEVFVTALGRGLIEACTVRGTR
jgi:Abortive infection alpha